MERVVIHDLSIRTDRTDRKSDIRSVNCISLVGLRIFSRQENVGTVCRSKEIAPDCKTRILQLILKRCSRFIAGFFGAKLFRAHRAL